MTFLELYGDALDLELGTEDRTERFTTVRRKAQINAAMLEWVRKTDSLVARYQLDLTDEIGEYDLESLINDDAFFRFVTEQPYLTQTDADGNVTYLEGENFPRVDVEMLDREQPGWRMASLGTPSAWYMRTLNNQTLFGVAPPPDIISGHTWSVQIPYSARPVAMAADDDTPLRSRSAGAVGRPSMEPFHQALVHRAAAQLEKLRKNREGMIDQQQQFEQYVRDYQNSLAPTGGERVSYRSSYFAEAQRGRRSEPDPDRE